jgi:uncharacterized membrane protein
MRVGGGHSFETDYLFHSIRRGTQQFPKSEYPLFPWMKKELKGRRFADLAEVQ